MIELRNLSCRYASRTEYVLKNLTFCCAAPGISVVAGPSGVGKSTLMSLLAGIHQAGDPVIGDLRGGILIFGKAPAELHRDRQISWVPQNPVLLDHLTVQENIMLPLTIPRNKPEEASRLASHLIQELELESFANARPRELSGGMKTRAALIRALITNPRVLFLDEPFVSLDLQNRWRIYRILLKLRSDENQTTILSTHNIPEAVILGNRLLILSKQRDQTVITTKNGHPHKADAMNLAVARELATPLESELFSLA